MDDWPPESEPPIDMSAFMDIAGDCIPTTDDGLTRAIIMSACYAAEISVIELEVGPVFNPFNVACHRHRHVVWRIPHYDLDRFGYYIASLC